MAIDNDAPELGRLPDTSILWRTGAWGGAASIALVAAVLVTQIDVGTKQQTPPVLAADAANSKAIIEARISPPAGNPETPALRLETQRLQEETQRLHEQVRELTADRDRLIARVASVERNLDDMTGAIKRSALPPAAAPQTPPPTVRAPQTMPPAATPVENDRAAPAPGGALSERAATAGGDAMPRTHVETRAEEMALPKVEPRAVARPESQLEPKPFAAEIPSQPPGPNVNVLRTPVRVAAIDANEPSQPAKSEIGIELGGARSMEILQARWLAVKANFGPMLVGMHPLFVHDLRPNVMPYKLLVGPVPNGAAAAQMCTRFAASRVSCRTTRFVGEQLVLQ